MLPALAGGVGLAETPPAILGIEHASGGNSAVKIYWRPAAALPLRTARELLARHGAPDAPLWKPLGSLTDLPRGSCVLCGGVSSDAFGEATEASFAVHTLPAALLPSGGDSAVRDAVLDLAARASVEPAAYERLLHVVAPDGISAEAVRHHTTLGIVTSPSAGARYTVYLAPWWPEWTGRA
jgi:hypothetical protein